MCSQATDDPKNSPYIESMNIPFIVRYPGKIQHRIDPLLMSSPDIMPTLLGLCNLDKDIPSTVQGTNFAPLFYNEKAKLTRPQGALYIRNMDGEKDENGVVLNYFPQSRGIKTARYTLALTISRDNKLEDVLFFDDLKDPYQMHNMKLENHPEEVKKLLKEMASQLKAIEDPWYTDRILSSMLPYDE